MIKNIVKRTPVIREIARSLMSLTVERRRRGFDSSAYWDGRYKSGENSGSGSYSRLAQFKAEFLNNFVKKHSINSVIEFGCGDGAQLKLAEYPSYLGIDVSPTVITATSAEFANDPSKKFLVLENYAGEQAEIALSLDVIYHLIEDEVFNEHMKALFESAKYFVIIYSSNKTDLSESPHVKHRRFTDWIEENGSWVLDEYVPNRYPFSLAEPDDTSFADFFVFRKA